MNRLCTMLLASTLCSGSLYAEGKPLVLTGLVEYYVSALSPNGKWACGSFLNYNYDTYSFRWNLESGQMELIGGGNVKSEAYDISNNGVVVGTFYSTEATTNGAAAQSAGYWDGEWHTLPNINNEAATTVDGATRARAISPDGQYIVGNAMDFTYAAMWKNGELAWSSNNYRVNDVYAVSPDGTMRAGWATPNGSDYILYERHVALWQDGKEPAIISDEKSLNGMPFAYARAFSSNGRYLLYWGGYSEEDPTMPYGVGLKAIYDTQTGEHTCIPSYFSDPAHMEYADINSNGNAVGYEQANASLGGGDIALSVSADDADGDDGTDTGTDTEDTTLALVFYKDGKAINLKTYLEEQGVDFSTIPSFAGLYRVLGLSDDEKTFAIQYYDANNGIRPLVVKLDQNVTSRPPVQTTASAMAGTKAVRVAWTEPLAGADGVKSYDIYRDGTKVGSTSSDELYYFDGPLATGSYTYTVKAVYADAVSEPSEAATASVAEAAVQAPRSLFARQARLQGAMMVWDKPQSNLTVKNYYLDTDEVTGFGGGAVSFESALRFPAAEMALYTDQKLTAVNFCPMTEQNGWTVNVYAATPGSNDLELLASKAVSQSLTYGVQNTVELDSPVSAPAGKDLYVAVKVDVKSDNASDNVLGEVYGTVEAGLTDLVRQASEADFYSLYDKAAEDGSLFPVTWAIDAIFTPNGAKSDIDNLDHYAVVADGTEVATTADKSYEFASLSQGEHTLGVAAVYADGRRSATASTTLNVTPNADFYQAIDNVVVLNTGAKSITAKWNAPTDADETIVTYGTGNSQGGAVGSESDNYSYMAAAEYPSSMFKGYEGYEITALRFMPGCTADFTLTLQADGEDVATVEPATTTSNVWNDVELPTPVKVVAGKTYKLLVDSYDPEWGKGAICYDDQVERESYSNLLSTDQGENFSTLYSSASLHGNWMIGLKMRSTEVKELPVTGYNVYIDNTKVNDEVVSETTYDHEFTSYDERNHRIRINAIYDVKGEVRGSTVVFTISTGTGISNAPVAQLTVNRNGSVLEVNGADVASLSLTGANGAAAAKASGNALNITALPAGTYVLSIKLESGEVRSQKLLIK